jgi:hypothetical protein
MFGHDERRSKKALLLRIWLVVKKCQKLKGRLSVNYRFDICSWICGGVKMLRLVMAEALTSLLSGAAGTRR